MSLARSGSTPWAFTLSKCYIPSDAVPGPAEQASLSGVAPLCRRSQSRRSSFADSSRVLAASEVHTGSSAGRQKHFLPFQELVGGTRRYGWKYRLLRLSTWGEKTTRKPENTEPRNGTFSESRAALCR